MDKKGVCGIKWGVVSEGRVDTCRADIPGTRAVRGRWEGGSERVG